MGRYDWPITKKKLKLERLPQNGNLNVRMEGLPFASPNIDEKGRTLSKGYEIK
jgi:hypothetical protein